jgi:hypothetical protein
MKNADLWFGSFFAIILAGLFCALFFGTGVTAHAWTAILAGAAIFEAATYYSWSSSAGGRKVPSTATITPEEALGLSHGDPIREGQDVLTVRGVERDRRQSSGEAVVVVATDEDGTERVLSIWGLSEKSVPQRPLPREHSAAQNMERSPRADAGPRKERSSAALPDERPQ